MSKRSQSKRDPRFVQGVSEQEIKQIVAASAGFVKPEVEEEEKAGMTDHEYIKIAWKNSQPKIGRPPTFVNPFPDTNNKPCSELESRLARSWIRDGP